MKRFFIAAISFYQRYISLDQGVLKRLFVPSCRFYPSCSEYAHQAFEKHSVATAISRTAWRIVRCNPFCRGGVDMI